MPLQPGDVRWGSRQSRPGGQILCLVSRFPEPLNLEVVKYY